MATTANLEVKISADSAKLKQGLSGAKGSVEKFAKNAAKNLAKIGTIVAASMTAATAAVTALINSTANEIDKLAKTSSKLGVPVRELQKLQYAAQLSGVGTDTLNMALQRMVRRVGEAAQGTGEAVAALQELGIDAKALNKLSPDQQFQKIANAFKNIGSQGDKVRLAFKLFDSEGVALVNTLGQDLNKLNKEFEELGLGITDSQAKAVEAFNDSKTRLGAIFDAIKQKVTANVAEPFQKIIDVVVQTIKEMGGIEKVSLSVAKVVLQSIQAIIQGFSGLIDIIQSVNNAFNFIKIGAAKLGTASARIIGQLGGDNLTDDQRSQIEADILKPTIDAFKESDAALNKTNEGLSLLDKISAELNNQIGGLTEETQKASQSVKGFAEITNAAGETLRIGGDSANKASKGGFGVITGADGRSLSTGNVPQEIKVQIQADDGLTAKVVNSPMNKTKIVEISNQNLDRERAKNVR
jgi:hypothetical protein